MVRSAAAIVEVGDLHLRRASMVWTVESLCWACSPWPSRPRTMTTPARRTSLSATQRRSTLRSPTCSRRAWTSSSSTSLTCRRARTRHASTASGRSTGPGGHHGDDCRAPVLRLRGNYPRTTLGVLGPSRTGRVRLRPGVGLDGAVRAGLRDPHPAGRQDDHPGRAQPRRRGRGEPGQIVARVRRALEYVPAERLVLAPDCGMKHLPARRRSASSSRSGWPPPCSARTRAFPRSPEPPGTPWWRLVRAHGSRVTGGLHPGPLKAR